MSYFVDAQRTTEKGAASGYASLDTNVLVPVAQLGTDAGDAKFLRGDRTWQVVSVDAHAALTTGTHGVTGTFVGTSDIQTLTSKTLTTPVITTPTINGAKVAIATKTDAYTALATDYVLLGDCTTAAFSITLPLAANSTGQIYNIKKIDADINHALTIDGNGANIDGAATKVITARYDSVTIVCNGTAWYII